MTCPLSLKNPTSDFCQKCDRCEGGKGFERILSGSSRGGSRSRKGQRGTKAIKNSPYSPKTALPSKKVVQARVTDREPDYSYAEMVGQLSTEERRIFCEV